ncbi:transcriptional regulator TrmB [Methanocaldococcus villosus KIN24-T80]|uniref:Transcriptional regulator TrmB n=1 Tax=Methanocaldococcus villosus KIN24-T80 TaxID=1069083 RepID=N6UW12_9EURY|nr:helix-turn-helix domain-containing protein [Methanocaldococcus villosus]ENN96514.1 transcriptional regulator TrmB [Methanocaldococcus villosus KIN24-T80]
MSKILFKTPCTTWTFDSLMSCVFGIKSSDVRVYFDILKHKNSKITDIANRLNRDRSTIQRSVQNLMSAGLVKRRQINLKDGGYYYVYSAIPFEEVKKKIKETLDIWYNQMKAWVEEIEADDVINELRD